MEIENYDDKQIGKLKHRILDENSADASEYISHQYLYDEWTESSRAGIDRHATSLADSTRNLKVFEALDPQRRTHLAYLKEYYDRKKSFLASFGAAFFYLEESLSVFEKGGDQRLLDKLKERGVRIGAVLSQENIGAFVANLALKTPFKTMCRIGNENYLDLFCGYACYARFGEHERSNFSTTTLVVLPIERLSPATHESICYVLSVEDLTFKNRFFYPTIEQKVGLLEKSAEFNPDAFLLINDQGEVVFSDRLFQQEFGHAPSSSNGEPLEQFMPELKPFLACLKGRVHTPHECFLSNAQGEHRFYPVECQQIREEDRTIIGLKISITSQQSARNKPSGSASFTFEDLKGETPAFRSVKETAASAALSSSNVLITGESGTGKEMFAQAIHNASPRKDAPFVPINCGAIPKELIGSELFGYEGGAFTGARKEGSPGKFEQANGGTVFLDEIAEMPLDMQSFLLRFLEDGVISRIGSKKFLNLDVRIIAATNKDLWECVQQHMFRLDLYFRLNVFHLDLPSLQDRPGDMELLINHFLANLSKQLKKDILVASPSVIDLFAGYSWPGNLRELRNVLERCVNTNEGSTLVIDSMPADVVETLRANKRLSEAEPSSMFQNAPAISSESVDSVFMDYEKHEVSEINSLMIKHHGNKTLVAREMGVSRGTLYRKLKRMEQ